MGNEQTVEIPRGSYEVNYDALCKIYACFGKEYKDDPFWTHVPVCVGYISAFKEIPPHNEKTDKTLVEIITDVAHSQIIKHITLTKEMHYAFEYYWNWYQRYY